MINVYSKSDSELGRLLSNFANTPFTDDRGRQYASVEGWWYWHVTGQKHPHLCGLHGWQAKQEGKKFPRVQEVTPEILRKVYLRKLRDNPHIRDMLLAYDGEFDHYYVYNGRKVPAPQWLWTAQLWAQVRDELRAS